MSKKTILIIAAIILGLFLFALLAYYFIINSNTVGNDGKPLGFRSFLPFGGNNGQTQTQDETGTTTEQLPTEENPNSQNFNQKLRKISNEPVAGAGTLDLKAGTIIRYIEKATGHIFEVELFSPRQARISNTTIPVVYDAVWDSKNESLVARYLKDDDQTIDTYSLTLKGISTTTDNTITGVSLPSNIDNISLNGSNIFFLTTGDNKSSGFISATDGTKRKQIWSSDIKELNSQFVNSKVVALTTKPAKDISGYLYFIDTTNGQSRRVLGDISGLSTLVDNLASQILLLNQSSEAKLSLYNIKNKSFISISPTTFPEKCVWSKKDINIVYCAVPTDYISGISLENWYQGLVSYSDDIWKYDLKNNASTMIEQIYSDSKEDIDVIKPILSENEQYLVFINKKDNTLWSLDLLQTSNN